MTPDPAVVADSLAVVRGGRTVLGPLSATVRAGRVTGLLGPSGCGKTTFMRAVVGVQAAVTGTVQVLGLPAGHRSLRASVAYVTQAPSVYGDLSVTENLSYFAAVSGADRSRVPEVITAVQLEPHADQVVSSLSGGERTRVSLAAALLGRARLLVLDEPTVGLDPVVRRDLWRLFHELATDGAAVLVSSHVMDEAGRCDDLLLLREGALLATGSPAQLLDRTGARDLDEAFLRLVES